MNFARDNRIRVVGEQRIPHTQCRLEPQIIAACAVQAQVDGDLPALDIGSPAHVGHPSGGNELEPNRLPDARRAWIPDGMGTELPILLAAGFCQVLRIVLHPNHNGLNRIRRQQGGDVELKRRITAFVLAGKHEGGYTPFQFDISPLLTPNSVQTIVVRVEDDPQDLAKPRGKQDWQLGPHSIWYPRTTGIWQTVWLELVFPTWMANVRWTPNVERWEISIDLRLDGARRDNLRLKATLRVGNSLLADDTYTVVAGEVHRRIVLSDPGIDDYRNELLWRPSKPTLIECQLQLWGERGELLDEAESYTALRAIGVQGDRFVLNGRPYPLRMVLDQGYWPNSGLTPPDDDALRADVELVKGMGFNGVRKHQKIEDPRYLYWADKLGLLVWEEMPSAYRFTKTSIERLAPEWVEVNDRDWRT